ncbi:hypothetical protein, partial [Xanthomonas campestris]
KIQTRLSRAMRHPALSGLIVQTFLSAIKGGKRPSSAHVASGRCTARVLIHAPFLPAERDRIPMSCGAWHGQSQAWPLLSR